MFRNQLYLGFLLALQVSCIPEKAVPKTIALYPTSDTLPENLLRCYVQFSHPMKAVDNLENIKLIDENNTVVKGAIFNNVYELWDAEQQQLTLILDPARVKTGLSAHEHIGSALVTGKSYRLVIEKMETVNHLEVKRFEKQFFVVPSDTIAPSMAHWNLQFPQVGSRDTLRISFRESIDRMSLYHSLTIADSDETVIKGSIEIGAKEKEWKFTPIEKWKKGSYKIHVNTRFADPSGNNLNGLFDHKIGSLKYEKEGERIEIPFSL
ncbi:MAG: hypothetical protein AAGF77_06465 [Bacteroidota bacterium]